MELLNEKLAMWAGFKRFPGGGWGHPKYEGARVLRDFDVHLDLCFKYLVPTLLEDYNIEFYSFKQAENFYYSEVNIWEKGSTKHSIEVLHDEHISKQFEQGEDLNKITAKALCGAIEQLMESEGKDLFGY